MTKIKVTVQGWLPCLIKAATDIDWSAKTADDDCAPKTKFPAIVKIIYIGTTFETSNGYRYKVKQTAACINYAYYTKVFEQSFPLEMSHKEPKNNDFSNI